MHFAHMGDCHLGSWRQPELKELNFASFQEAISRIIKKKVDFLLIAGDLFDSAYPPIETLKDTFSEFRKLHQAKIPVFLIAGSHDYSVTGKTFLDVLEKSGFCKNVSNFQEKNGKILLEPTVCKGAAIYGFPGKKSGMEVDEIERIKLLDSPGLFKILLLHTTIRDAVGNLPINAVDETKLPSVDYLALAHLHINYKKGNKVYCGPTFPNNISEIEELKHGSFYFFNNGQVEKQQIKLKEVVSMNLEVSSTIGLTDNILSLINQEKVKDKIVVLRLSGLLEKGKISDIDFQKIESTLSEAGAFVFLKSTSKLHTHDSEIKIDVSDYEDLEARMIERFQETDKTNLSTLIPNLFNSLSTIKNEDETNLTFQERFLSETRKILQI